MVATAKSSKVATPTGARVVTVVKDSEGGASQADAPAEIRIPVPAGKRAGVSFKGCAVSGVTASGLAEKSGVKKGWVLLRIEHDDKRRCVVCQIANGGEVMPALQSARTQGKDYVLVFQVFAEKSGAAEEVRPVEKVGEEKVDTVEHSAVAAPEEVSPGEVVVAEGVEPTAQEPRGASDVAAPAASPGVEQESDATAAEEVSATAAPAPAEDEAATAAAAADKAAQDEREAAAKKDADDLAARAEGEVCLKYEMYDEMFPISGNSLTAAAIDDTYCLSFVMPGCRLFLCTMPSAEKNAKEEEGVFVPFVQENPVGTFLGLLAGETYWVYVSQNPEQLLKDQAEMKDKLGGEVGALKAIQKDDGRGFETCSCIYGNPCVDEYGCKDWYNRMAVAKANGWKGF